MDMRIPKLLHQTFPTSRLPPPLLENSRKMAEQNPGWTYKLYNDDDVEQFIYEKYGDSVLSSFLRISPLYGAARADLFRYLLMYEMGGVYIDMKSAFASPLDGVLALNEGYVLSKWMNGPGEEHGVAGLHPELSFFPRGEFQQWHIICAPKHPFLAAVVERVLDNISRYTPWRSGVGRAGVLRTTGPIPYTLAIEPMKALHKHVELRSHHDIGLLYSCIGRVDHRGFFRHHYTQMDTPIIRFQGTKRILVGAYISTRRLKHRLFRRGQEL